jgi:hypothetical protein
VSEPALAADLFWEFARAESVSDRYRDRYRPLLDSNLVRALDGDDRTGLSDVDWDKLAIAVLNVRWPMTLGPIRLATSWHYDTFTTRELGSLRFVHMEDFESVAPSRTISELARGIHAGNKFPPRADEEDFGKMAERRAREFDAAKLRGAIVLLCIDGLPPYLLIEGLTRVTALTLRAQRSEPVPSTVRVLIGTCPNLADWRFY